MKFYLTLAKAYRTDIRSFHLNNFRKFFVLFNCMKTFDHQELLENGPVSVLFTREVTHKIRPIYAFP